MQYDNIRYDAIRYDTIDRNVEGHGVHARMGKHNNGIYLKKEGARIANVFPGTV